MGSRFGFFAVSQPVSAEQMVGALGACIVQRDGTVEFELPYCKVDSDEVWYLQRDGWSFLVCPYNAGVLRDYDAAPLALIFSSAREVRYYGQQDTTAELFVQFFKDSRLVFSHFEHEGTIDQGRAIGLPPPRTANETDEEQLFAMALPFDLSGASCDQLRIQWPQPATEGQRRPWWRVWAS